MAHSAAEAMKPTTNAVSTDTDPCCSENVSPPRSTVVAAHPVTAPERPHREGAAGHLE